MRLFILLIVELIIVNIHFLFGRYLGIFELQPNPLLIMAVFLILKADEEILFPSLMLTGILADCFFTGKFGPYLSLFLICGFLFKDSRNVMFKDHFMTHVLFVFGISLVGVFLIYLFGGVFTLRAPIVLSVYNALWTPVFYYVFDFIKFERLVKAV